MARLRTMGTLVMCAWATMARVGVVAAAAVAVDGRQAQQDCARDRSVLPANVTVSDMLRPIVVDLFARSATFREQCRRIADARQLRVSVESTALALTPSNERARTTIRRYASGAATAVVQIPLPLRRDDASELLGHEFEHIVEQIDRVALVDLTGRGEARVGAGGAFETDRAVIAGRRVAAEAEPAAPVPAVRHDGVVDAAGVAVEAGPRR